MNRNYYVDVVAGEIVITKNFAKAASKVGTKEFNEMVTLKKSYPEFTFKYKEIAKKADKDDDIKQAYIKLQNMGIIILPNLLKKIETGDTDLIPMFCYLSDQKDLKTADDCKRWWKTNKEKYKDILVESESLCTFDSD